MSERGGWRGPADAAGMAVLLLLTFFLQAACSVPRMIFVAVGMMALWNQAHSPDPLQEILYLGFDFLFALLVGALAMAGCRLFVPQARRLEIGLGAAVVILCYAILTIILRGRVPAFFFPIYLDLAAAVPGWLIGYYLAAGRETRARVDLVTFTLVGAPAFTIVAAVVIAPSLMPFYMPGAILPRPAVQAPAFHPVAPPPAPAASFTPAPPADTLPPSDAPDQLPIFHNGGSNGL